MLLAAGLGMSAGSAFGVTQTYFGIDFNPDAASGSNPTPLVSWPNADMAETQFKSNLVGVTTETFEGVTAEGTPFSDFHGMPIDERIEFNPMNFARISQDSLLIDQSLVAGVNDGRYPTSGTNRLFIPQAQGEDTVISFEDENGVPAPQAAFGFFGVDIGDFGGALLVLTQMDGSTQEYDVSTIFGPHGSGTAANGSVLFFGVIDTENPFTSIILRNTAPGTDGFAFDDFTIGRIENVMIPLPSVAGLGAFGLMGLASRRRRAL
jgi:hypothetical protein